MILSPADLRAQLTIARAALDAIDQGLPADVPVPPVALHVAVGGNLQAAIDAAAVSGQDVLVAPGTYPGPIWLRARPAGSLPVTIRPDVDPSTLPTGRRTTPAPVIIAPAVGSNLGIGTDKGARGWTLQDLGVSSPGAAGTMVELDAGATTLADVPDSITLLRVYLDGGNSCKRGIAANASNFQLLDSSVVGVFKTGQDTQAVGAWNGSGPFLIQNNYLSASGETILFGGSDPGVPNLIPSDIVIRGNYVTKDLAWQTAKGSTKNAFELKNAQRVLVEHNIFERAWIDEQTGWLIQFTVRNQNGGAPWSTVRDVEFRYNVVRHGWQGINLLGLDDENTKVSTDPPWPSVRMSGINIHHNLFYDLGAAGYGTGTRIAIATNNGIIGLTIDHNTFLGSVSEAMSLSLGKSKTVSTGMTVTNNVLPEGSYGLMGDGTAPGVPSWAVGVDVTSVFDYNLIAQGSSGRKILYPGAHTVVVPGLVLTLPFIAPAFVTSDGTLVGGSVADLQARIAEFDPTQ